RHLCAGTTGRATRARGPAGRRHRRVGRLPASARRRRACRGPARARAVHYRQGRARRRAPASHAGDPAGPAGSSFILSRMLRLSRVVIGLLLLCVTFTAACADDPPTKEMNQAQGAIDAARAAGAEQYAPEDFKAAVAALQRSHEAVTQRDYRQALNDALDARE